MSVTIKPSPNTVLFRADMQAMHGGLHLPNTGSEARQVLTCLAIGSGVDVCQPGDTIYVLNRESVRCHPVEDIFLIPAENILGVDVQVPDIQDLL